MGKRERGKGKGDGWQNPINSDYDTPVPFTRIDLQWFSDDAEAEGRTEQPTEHKLRRLREEGQVPKSQELVGAVTLFLPALLLLFIAPYMLRTCMEMLRFFFLRNIFFYNLNIVLGQNGKNLFYLVGICYVFGQVIRKFLKKQFLLFFCVINELYHRRIQGIATLRGALGRRAACGSCWSFLFLPGV